MPIGNRLRARSALATLLAAATSLMWSSNAQPALAADGSQSPTPVLEPSAVDTSTTGFALAVEGGAKCDGTGSQGWRVHTFIVNAGVDLQTLDFTASGSPGYVGTDFDMTDGSVAAPLHKGVDPAVNVLPGETPAGLINPDDLVGFTFDESFWSVASGEYQIGFACVAPPSNAIRQWWSVPVTIDTSASPFMVANAVDPGPVNTTLTLTADPATKATEGDEVTLTATMSPGGAAGTVTFYQGNDPLGAAVAVAGGKATFSTDDLDVGTLQLKATFTPTDAEAFKTSTGTLGYTVESATAKATTVTLTVSPASTAAAGASVTVSATVQPADAAGTIVFTRTDVAKATADLGTAVAVANGVASMTVTDLPVGEHELRAKFVPTDDDAFKPAESLVVRFTVTEAAASTTSSTSTTGTTSTTVPAQVLGQTGGQGGQSGGRSALAATGRSFVLVVVALLLVYLGRVAHLLARPRDVTTRG